MVQEACINYQNNENDVEAKLHLLKIMYLTAEIAAEIKIYSEVCAKNKETVDDDYWLWKENISKSTAKWVSDCVLEIIDNNPDIIKGFSRAINKGLKFVSDNDAETIAKSIISFFPDTALNDLITMIDRYKKGDAYRETISINEEEWKHIQDIMIAAGELDEYAPYDKLIYGKYFNEFE